MTEAQARAIPPEVCVRHAYYDIAHDIHWWELSNAEVEVIQAARKACGLECLVFTSHLAAATDIADQVAFMAAVHALRAALAMPYPSHQFTQVLEVAAARLRGSDE
jgi:hypothetical protein